MEKHADVIARILFIYAKLNPVVKYVQGMNEVLAPIYYCFAQDTHPEYSAYAEEDTFFWFTCLMSEIRDGFVKFMDNDREGISGYMSKLSDLLEQHDPVLWDHLEDNKV